MKCPSNCGKCCGVIPLPVETFQKYKDKSQIKIIKLNKFHNKKVLALTEDLSCVFLDRKTKRCVIYEDRPNICKSFEPSECIFAENT